MRTTVTVLTLLCLAACNSGTESTVSPVAGSTTAVVASPASESSGASTTTEASSTEPRALSRAEQVAGALGCGDVRLSALSAEADSTVTCLFDGARVRIDVFPSYGNYNRYMTLLRTSGCDATRAQGLAKMYLATSTLWLITPPKTTDGSIAAAAIDQLGGRVLTIDCHSALTLSADSDYWIHRCMSRLENEASDARQVCETAASTLRHDGYAGLADDIGAVFSGRSSVNAWIGRTKAALGEP